MSTPPPPPDPYAGQPTQRPGQGMAITALVLGIIALLFSWTVFAGLAFGVGALVLGLVAASRAKRGLAGGRGLAITGAVLGVLGALVAGAIIAFGAAILNLGETQELEDCLVQAGEDQAAIEQCNRQFEDDLVDRFGG